jgi:hypothetical protein
MAKKQQFTFKTTKPTGRYAWTSNPWHEIKLNKVVVGTIGHGTWEIRLKVIKADINEDKNPNCPWKWITLKNKSESLDETKIFLNENINEILEKCNLFIKE